MKPKNIVKRGEVYHFRATVGGRQVWQSLETGDQKLAAGRARRLRDELSAGRWETLMGLKTRNSWSSVGEVIEAYRAYTARQDIRPHTVQANVMALLRIIRTVKACEEDAAKALRASVLTADLLREYQEAKIEVAKPDGPLAVDRAKSTSHSTVRQARSLFARHCLSSRDYQGLTLPDLSDFLQCRLQAKGRELRQPPAPALIEATAKAAGRLKQSDPARWLAFILCSNLGLRRSEAIAAQWSWVDAIQVQGEKLQADGAVQRIEQTCYVMSVIKRETFDPKGSPRLISIHPDTWREMQSVQVSIDTIIPGDAKSREAACVANVAWLRKLGWNARLPNHALRGLFGSTVASQHGLFAAQSALGHADPRTTTDSYATWLGLDKVVKVF